MKRSADLDVSHFDVLMGLRMLADTTPIANHRTTTNPWLAVEVRPWLTLTFVLLAVAIATSVFRMAGYVHERGVILNGPVIDASVLYIGRSYAREGTRDEALYVCLRYTAPDGKNYETWNDLPRKPGELLSAKQTLSVHLDPADYAFWTALDAPPPLGLVLAIPLLCLPAAVVCGALAWLKQRTVAKWIDSTAVRAARVVNVKVSPLAPLSKLIGVNLAGDTSGRILHCYWPSRRGPVTAGSEINVLTDAAAKRCVVA